MTLGHEKAALLGVKVAPEVTSTVPFAKTWKVLVPPLVVRFQVVGLTVRLETTRYAVTAAVPGTACADAVIVAVPTL